MGKYFIKFYNCHYWSYFSWFNFKYVDLDKKILTLEKAELRKDISSFESQKDSIKYIVDSINTAIDSLTKSKESIEDNLLKIKNQLNEKALFVEELINYQNELIDSILIFIEKTKYLNTQLLDKNKAIARLQQSVPEELLDQFNITSEQIVEIVYAKKPNVEPDSWNNTDIIIYPNPSKALINVDFRRSQSKTNFLFSIINLNGKTELSDTISSGKKSTFDIENLKSGVYIANFQNIDNHETITKKIIKK